MSRKIIDLILERAAPQVTSGAEILSQFITGGVDVDEMRASRGGRFSETQFYQIRVKPRDKATELETILTNLEKFLTSAKAKKMGISEVQVNQNSRNSSKYSSVSFSFGGNDYDIVVAKGGNKGENFEKKLLLDMNNLAAGIDSSDEATAAFAALQKVDPVFKLSNIASVSPRTGTTQRSGSMSPEETGKIIADIIVKLKKGGERYISVKNKDGSTLAQFGLSKAFKDDLSVDTKSEEWKSWIEPFGLDPKKIEEGLKSARDGTELPFPDIEKMDDKVKKTSQVYKIMQKMWGANYYYLRETKGGFKAFKVDSDFVDNELLKNLKVTEVRYPGPSRKQITMYLESDSMKYKVEFRNPRGRGSVKPTQIQLIIMKGAK